MFSPREQPNLDAEIRLGYERYPYILTGNYDEQKQNGFEDTQALWWYVVVKRQGVIVVHSTFMNHTPNRGVKPWRRVTNTITERELGEMYRSIL